MTTAPDSATDVIQWAHQCARRAVAEDADLLPIAESLMRLGSGGVSLGLPVDPQPPALSAVEWLDCSLEHALIVLGPCDHRRETLLEMLFGVWERIGDRRGRALFAEISAQSARILDPS